MRALAGPAIAVAALVAWPGTVFGGSAECDAAYTRAQEARAAGRFASARRDLIACARAECGPAAGSAGSIQRDCASWLEEDLLKTPTLVLGAHDDRGDDLLAVRVTLDGALVDAPLDGKPIEVDTGAHTVVFEGNGARVTRRVVSRYGERGVVVVVSLAPPRPAAADRRPGPAPEAAQAGMSPWRLAGLVGAGIGLAGVGVGTGFALAASAANDDAACDATELCARPDRRRDAQRLGAVATAGFVAGGVLVVGGGLLALLAPRAGPRVSRVRVAPTLGVGGGGLVLDGAF